MVSLKTLGTSQTFFFLRCIQNFTHALNGRQEFIFRLLQAVSRVKLSTCSCGHQGNGFLGQSQRRAHTQERLLQDVQLAVKAELARNKSK